MAMLKDVELWFAKLDPKRPSSKFNKTNPTWEVQGRTKSKTQKKEWEELGLSVKAVVPDEGDPYFRINLKKKSIKEDESHAGPVEVVGGKRGEDGKFPAIDPNSIGNGSVGNIRIFQYDYPKKEGGTGKAAVLMAIQLTKHILYVPKPREDDFDEEEMETIDERGVAPADDDTY